MKTITLIFLCIVVLHFASLLVVFGLEEGTFHNQFIAMVDTTVFRVFNFPFDSVNNNGSFFLPRFLNSVFWSALIFGVIKTHTWAGKKFG
jgi:hypothetical protein